MLICIKYPTILRNIILASTSTLYGENYLEYLLPVLKTFYKKGSTLLFIPFARPGGISHELYTRHTKIAFASIGIKVKGLHEYKDPKQALEKAEGIFTGGGNTFVLVKMLHELDLMNDLRRVILRGTPYLGCSAGSNIAGISMQTTNDMPIVMPQSFETTAVVPFNINAHYIDPDPLVKHNGESRATRIKEFHLYHKIPVIGIREGDYIRVISNEYQLIGGGKAKLFFPDQEPYDSYEIPQLWN